jgi:hypothetical protein
MSGWTISVAAGSPTVTISGTGYLGYGLAGLVLQGHGHDREGSGAAPLALTSVGVHGATIPARVPEPGPYAFPRRRCQALLRSVLFRIKEFSEGGWADTFGGALPIKPRAFKYQIPWM